MARLRAAHSPRCRAHEPPSTGSGSLRPADGSCTERKCISASEENSGGLCLTRQIRHVRDGPTRNLWRGELDVERYFRGPAGASDTTRRRRRAPAGPDHRRNNAQASIDGQAPRHARHRRDHRRGHLRADRPGRRDACRPRRRAELRLRRHRLRVRGPVLRRVRLDAAGFGQRVLVFVRDARRDRRLVHRLDADPRIPLRGLDRRGRLVRLFQQPARLDRRARRHAPRAAGRHIECAADGDRRPHIDDRRAHQSARRADRRRDQLGLLRRHHAIGVAERGRRRDQARRDPALHRVLAAVRQRGELASVRAADGRCRPLRLAGRVPCRVDRVLLVHRLRCGLDRGAGSEESAARHADRHPRLAGRLHDPLHHRRGSADRHHAVHAARHGASGRRPRSRVIRACAGCASSSRSVRSPASRR